MKSYFAQLLELPMETQFHWRDWRDAQLVTTPRAVIIANADCPLKSCQAPAGQECRTHTGQPTYHETRHNEYFAERFLREKVKG